MRAITSLPLPGGVVTKRMGLAGYDGVCAHPMYEDKVTTIAIGKRAIHIIDFMLGFPA